MSAIRVLGYIGATILGIAAAILIFFGVLFVWGAFSPSGSAQWIRTGSISIVAGLALVAAAFGLIWFARRQEAKGGPQEIIQRVEISGDVSLEKMTCRSCGGTLSSDNVKVVAGAPVVNCPYCGASYHLEEEPKW